MLNQYQKRFGEHALSNMSLSHSVAMFLKCFPPVVAEHRLLAGLAALTLLPESQMLGHWAIGALLGCVHLCVRTQSC